MHRNYSLRQADTCALFTQIESLNNQNLDDWEMLVHNLTRGPVSCPIPGRVELSYPAHCLSVEKYW